MRKNDYENCYNIYLNIYTKANQAFSALFKQQ